MGKGTSRSNKKMNGNPDKSILENTNMNLSKYIINYVLLPYYNFAKHFLNRNSFPYKFFVILNLIWIVFLFAITCIGIWSCLV